MLRLRHNFTALTLVTAMALPLATPSFAADEARTWTKEELQNLIKETMLDNPETILSSVEKLQEAKAKEDEENARQAVKAYHSSIYENALHPVAGPEDADVTMVEFFDFNCGYCKQSLPNVVKLMEADKKVRVIFIDFPVIAPSSETGARAGMAFYKLNPEKYFEFHSALFKMGGRFDDGSLKTVAGNLGVDGDELIKTMNSVEVKTQVQANLELGSKMGTRGVPLFIIGEETFPGAIPYDRMKIEVERARENLKKK